MLDLKPVILLFHTITLLNHHQFKVYAEI